MIYVENKYYLRPNRSIDLEYGTLLSKSDDAIKLGGVFFSHIEVIERNKKDIINNQFWADNRNACGLNISDIDYMTDTDKEIVQRNKNVVLDMCEGKITS